MILEYTDYQDTNYNEQYHVFFGNPEVDIPTQFRFHECKYIQIQLKINLF